MLAILNRLGLRPTPSFKFIPGASLEARFPRQVPLDALPLKNKIGRSFRRRPLEATKPAITDFGPRRVHPRTGHSEPEN